MPRPSVFGPPPPCLTETVRIRAKCSPHRIGLVNSLIDAYEGLAAVRTVTAAEGILEFWVSRKQENPFRLILNELAKQVELDVEKGHDNR